MVQGTTNQAIRGGQTSGLLGDAAKDNTNYNQQNDMSRKEDFIQAGIDYRFEHGKPMAIGGDNFAEMAKEMNRCKDYEAGAEYGYQYAKKRLREVLGYELDFNVAKFDDSVTTESLVDKICKRMEE